MLALAFAAGMAWLVAGRLRAAERETNAQTSNAVAEAETRARDGDIKFYEKRAAEDPISAGDRAKLAALHIQRARETGDYEDVLTAEKWARESISLRTAHNSEVNVALISSLLEQHRFAEARDITARLVAEEPAVNGYRALLGEISLEVGDYAGARAAFDSLTPASRNTLSIAPRIARWLEITGDTQAARLILHRARRTADSSGHLPRETAAWYHLRVADIEMRNGKLKAAERALESGRQIRPSDYRLLAAETHLAALRQDWRRVFALGDSTIAMVLDPGTIGLVGDAYTALGDTARAADYVKAMEVAVVRQPGAYHRAWSLFLLDHGVRIPEVAAKVREELKTRRDIYGYDLFGWALYKEGRYAEARQALGTALSQGTQDAVLFYHAGMIERAAGNHAASRRFLERALTLNPVFGPTQPRAARATLDSLKREGA